MEGTSGFADVPADAYYADGVAWAVQEGITAGKTPTAFCPNEVVSKEDFSVMLHRLCIARHGVPEVSPDALVNMQDAGDIHGYARDAMAWAVEALVLVNKNLPFIPLAAPAPLTRGDLAHLLRQYDCLLEGHPAQLYMLDPDEIKEIAVSVHQGEVAFLITEPAEIQRFVEKINGFTYTGQNTPAGAGRVFPYYAMPCGSGRRAASPRGFIWIPTALGTFTPLPPQISLISHQSGFRASIQQHNKKCLANTSWAA